MVRTLRDVWPMESVFASLKVEHVATMRSTAEPGSGKSCAKILDISVFLWIPAVIDTEAKAAVFDYIEVFYNRQHPHSALGYRTPVEARASMEEITMPAAA